MARGKRLDPEFPEEKEMSQEDISLGIDKLQRRIRDVLDLRPSQTQYDDPIVETAQLNIRETIREIFGTQSAAYAMFQDYEIANGPIYMEMPSSEMQEYFIRGVPNTVKHLEGLIERLREKEHYLEVQGTAPGVPTIEGLSLHDRIATVAVDLYRDGHYSNAVFDASKALINYVKEKSGEYALDGAKLMRTVFSRNSPVLALNSLQSQEDQDEQEGIMHLFEGAVLAIRNPRGHAFYADSPDQARGYLLLISMLAKLVDNSTRRSSKL